MEKQIPPEKNSGESRSKARYAVSAVLPDGSLAEAVLRPDEQRTVFCVWKDGNIRYVDKVMDGEETVLPYSARNNLLRNEVVRLPSQPVAYESVRALLSEIRTFIHRFVDVGPVFEAVATHYVLLTWVHDAFNELPYLRVIGEPGSGKTRFLLTVGSLCYKPIFASGASSVSPIFRMLDGIGGTLIIDEGDFRASDERAEIVKILNNGHARGFPVLRSELTPSGEYNPKAYRVFGPKIVATRGFFQDRALESRCITEELGQKRLRDDVPINLPPSHKIQALMLRNKLLAFRFENLEKAHLAESVVDRSLEPRLNQVFAPLLSLVQDESTRQEIQGLARRYNEALAVERGMDTEAQVLEIIRDMLVQGSGRLPIKDIADWFADRYGDDYERKVTAKWIGWVIRKRLRLATQKSHGVFVIADSEASKLDRLFERYGVNKEDATVSTEIPPPDALPRVDMGDFGDFKEGEQGQGSQVQADP